MDVSRHLALFGLICALGFGTAHSQDADGAMTESIQDIQSQLLQNLRWIPDSQFLVFQKGVPGVDDTDEWYIYDIQAAILARTANGTYPVNLFIDTRQSAAIEAAIPSSQKWLPYVESPQGRYLLYLEPVGQTTVMDVAAFDGFNPVFVDTKQAHEIRIDEPPTGPYPDIFWSSDENNVVLSSIMGDFINNFTYVAHFGDDIDSAISFSIDVAREGKDYLTFTDVFNLAANGEQALLRVRADFRTQATALYLYDGSVPANSHLLVGSEQPQSIHAAEFSPIDETKILMLVDAGLFEYDMTTQKLRPLDTDTLRQPSDSGSLLKDAATFSPDGRTLASYGIGGFYLTDLTDFLQVPNTTLSPNLLPKANGLARLWLTVACPSEIPSPDLITWTIHNPNAEAVTITWGTAFDPGTEVNQLVVQGGSNDVPAIATFQTPAEEGSDNRVEILVNDVLHDSRTCTLTLKFEAHLVGRHKAETIVQGPTKVAGVKRGRAEALLATVGQQRSQQPCCQPATTIRWLGVNVEHVGSTGGWVERAGRPFHDPQTDTSSNDAIDFREPAEIIPGGEVRAQPRFITGIHRVQVLRRPHMHVFEHRSPLVHDQGQIVERFAANHDWYIRHSIISPQSAFNSMIVCAPHRVDKQSNQPDRRHAGRRHEVTVRLLFSPQAVQSTPVRQPGWRKL